MLKKIVILIFSIGILPTKGYSSSSETLFSYVVVGFGAVENSGMNKYSKDFRNYYSNRISNSKDKSYDGIDETFCFGPLGAGLRYYAKYFGYDLSIAFQGVRSKMNKIEGDNGSAESYLFLEVFSFEPNVTARLNIASHQYISFGIGPGFYLAIMDEKTKINVDGSSTSRNKRYNDKSIGYTIRMEYLIIKGKGAFIAGVMYRHAIFKDLGFQNIYADANSSFEADMKGLFYYVGFGSSF